jgi:phage-related tail fiber protein
VTFTDNGTITISGIGSVTDESGNSLTIPPGAVQFFVRNTAPSGWIKANGATISRSTYAALFSAIGTTFGAGDGSTTFTIPDLRGEFLRSWDDSRGIDSGRGFGSAQGFGIPRMIGGVADSHGFAAMQPISVSGFTNPFYGLGTSVWRTSIENVNTNFQIVYFDSARIIAASPDVRPRNIALLACIKY